MYRRRLVAAISAGLILPFLAMAKDKPKSTLPTYVLQARTVSVIIDPTAGKSLEDPRANEVAQRDVETALMNWGRFQPVLARRRHTPASSRMLRRDLRFQSRADPRAIRMTRRAIRMTRDRVLRPRSGVRRPRIALSCTWGRFRTL
jgi:hypothetical protein